jgi:hypothetical protein
MNEKMKRGLNNFIFLYINPYKSYSVLFYMHAVKETNPDRAIKKFEELATCYCNNFRSFFNREILGEMQNYFEMPDDVVQKKVLEGLKAVENFYGRVLEGESQNGYGAYCLRKINELLPKFRTSIEDAFESGENKEGVQIIAEEIKDYYGYYYDELLGLQNSIRKFEGFEKFGCDSIKIDEILD